MMTAGTLWSIAEVVPPEWYGGDVATLERLIEELLQRRGRVRELIVAFRESDRAPFPKWGSSKKIVVPGRFGEVPGGGKFVM